MPELATATVKLRPHGSGDSGSPPELNRKGGMTHCGVRPPYPLRRRQWSAVLAQAVFVAAPMNGQLLRYQSWWARSGSQNSILTKVTILSSPFRTSSSTTSNSRFILPGSDVGAFIRGMNTFGIRI
jgi:hypothetical protein